MLLQFRKIGSTGLLACFVTGMLLTAQNNTPVVQDSLINSCTAGIVMAQSDLFIAPPANVPVIHEMIMLGTGENDESAITTENTAMNEDPSEDMMYTSAALNVREAASVDSAVLETLPEAAEVSILSLSEDGQWAEIAYQSSEAYVATQYLQPEAPEPVPYELPAAWDGSTLRPGIGTVQGPSGKETYYNLNMDGVIKIMRGIGNEDEYWVREDGVKMLGDYIMVAANLDVHPRGSLVETSLGTAIVCDTGDFAFSNPTQLDVAVVW